MNTMILKLYVMLQELKNREEGQTMVEYGLLAAIISLAAIAVLPGIGTSLLGIFTRIGTALSAA